METSLKSLSTVTFSCLTSKYLAELHEMLVEEDFDILIEELTNVHHEYANYMTVALNEDKQLLGENILCLKTLSCLAKYYHHL